MQEFDQTVPPFLKDLQEWFGNVISQPIKDNNALDPVPTEYILPGPELSAQQRIEIYHQQYWWRLIDACKENFPTVTRVFGHKEFRRKIAVPYLHAFPPSHFSLSHLGDTLCLWVEKNYHETDKALLQIILEIDWAINRSFWIGPYPQIPPQTSPEIIFNSPLRLQSHVHLFSLEADYFSFRDEINKNDVEFYNKNHFPKLIKEPCYVIVFRDTENIVTWKKLSKGAFILLNFIKEGLTLSLACEKLESYHGDPFLQAEKEISLWLYEWISKQWITLIVD